MVSSGWRYFFFYHKIDKNHWVSIWEPGQSQYIVKGSKHKKGLLQNIDKMERVIYTQNLSSHTVAECVQIGRYINWETEKTVTWGLLPLPSSFPNSPWHPGSIYPSLWWRTCFFHYSWSGIQQISCRAGTCGQYIFISIRITHRGRRENI